jgi:hypothetical protein
MSRRGIVCVVTVTAVVLAFADFQQLVAQGRRGGLVARGPLGVDDLTVASLEAVQKEVGARPEQKEKIKALADDVREEIMQQMSSASVGLATAAATAEERQKLAEIRKGINDKYLPKLATTLDKAQLKRVHEIAVQAAGAQALLDPGVQKDLALTIEQKEKLVSVHKEFSKTLADVPRAERMAKMREVSEEQLAKSTEILTRDQQAQFTSMKGKPFDVTLLRPQERGGGRPRPAPGGPRESDDVDPLKDGGPSRPGPGGPRQK